MKKYISITVAIIILLSNITGCKTNDNARMQEEQYGLLKNNINPKNNSIQEKANRLSTILVSNYGVTSMQYAIIDNGNIILSGNSGVYDKNESRPITKDTMYGIGSTSKIYVSAAAMMLVDSGKLDIDKPLIIYIPEFKMADDRYKQITPRMLLNHSSGIYGSHFNNVFLFDDNDTVAHDNLLSDLKIQSLKANPGEISEYCNDCITLLEILVERISSMGYSEFIQKYFSEPLGLTKTKTPLDNFDRNQLAKVYLPTYEGALPTETTNLIGSGGLYSTAEEMCKFSEIFMGHKTDILSEQSVQAMGIEEYKKGIWVSDNDENFFGFGLGWDDVHGYPFGNYKIKALFKGGDAPFYHSSLVVIPEHNIAMAVVSSGGASYFNYAFSANILQEVLKEKGVIDEISPDKTFDKAIKVEMRSDMQKYSGIYANATGSTKIEVKDGELIVPPLVMEMIPEQKYIYTGGGEFKSEDGSITISFEEQKDGETYLQVKAYLTLPEIGQLALVSYEYQKLTESTLDENLANIWAKRANQQYYLVNGKATSVFYFIPSPSSIKLSADMSYGYAYAGCKIIDENNAVNVLKFREVMDLTFYSENNIEYLKSKGFILIGENDIQEIYDGENFICTIQSNGFAKWYKIGAGSANKEMTVESPQNAAFAVYDENGVCVNFTTVSGENTAVLPPNGTIAFIGNAGDTFIITLK